VPPSLINAEGAARKIIAEINWVFCLYFSLFREVIMYLVWGGGGEVRYYRTFRFINTFLLKPMFRAEKNVKMNNPSPPPRNEMPLGLFPIAIGRNSLITFLY
jgi:hypothetical protein